jgi:two-component system response regulator (stage 0 sporulation protein A)
MKNKKPMPILLIEDDVAACGAFKECARQRMDVIFVGMTNSCAEGLNLVKAHVPEGIILDLELNRGKGSGLDFLEELKNENLDVRPLIIVTTNSPSEVVYNHVHNNGADLIFHKGKRDYSPDMVLNHMMILRKSMYSMRGDELPDDLQSLETPAERQARMSKRITAELSLVGISTRYKGYNYLHEAIQMLLNAKTGDSESVINKIAATHTTSYSAIARAMQTGINAGWSTTHLEDLEQHYTFRINVKTGVPSPTELIHFYADKIRKAM